MNGLNRIFLLGLVGNPPQLYSTKNGKTYAGVSIATHRFRSNTEFENEKQETTDWHFVRIWGPQAQTCAKYLSRGQPVLIEGYLTHYNTQNPSSGAEEKKTGINAIRVEFLPKGAPREEIETPEA